MGARTRRPSWNYRWAFSGQGTLVFEIQVEPVKVDAAGNLTQRWYHAQYGGWNAFALDPTTLAATAMLGRSLPYPVFARDRRVDDRRACTCAGKTTRAPAPTRRVLYMLRWETLDSNRDMPRSPIPRPRACASTASRSRFENSPPPPSSTVLIPARKGDEAEGDEGGDGKPAGKPGEVS